jgi:glutaconyl-CoA decarboxylase
MAELSRPTDPGAVRVRLEAGSRLADEPAIEVSPAPEPLRMTNPTVGTGLLGGHAMTPPEVAAEPAVLAQRQVLVDGEVSDATLRPLAAGRNVLEEGTSRSRVILEPYAASGGLRSREVMVDGFRFIVEVEPARIAALRERATSARGAAAHAGPLQVKAIIPGKVVAVSVKAGDAVTAGQQLLVVEAMKMQNELRAPRDGTIERVSVAAGVSIEIGDLLVVIS